MNCGSLWARLLVVGLVGGLFACTASPAPAAVEVVYQEVVRDQLLPMNTWQDASRDPETYFPEQVIGGALVRVYLQSERPLAVSSLALDGTLIETLHEETFDVPWYRIVPLRDDPALTKIEVRVHEAKQNAQPYVLDIRMRDGSVKRVEMSNQHMPYALGSMMVSEDGYWLTGHLVRYVTDDFDVQNVWLNGEDVSERFRMVGDQWYGDVAAFEITLDEPLQEGEACLLRIDDGVFAVAGDIRAFHRPFSVGIYGGPAASLQELGFNTVLRYGSTVSRESFDAHEAHGLMLISRMMNRWQDHTPEQRALIATHPAVYAIYGIDEPDVKDYHLTDVPSNRRVGRTGMEVERMNVDFRREQPGRLVYMVVNHTYTPRNWFTYGPMTDINAIDPYPFVKTQTIRGGDNMKDAIGDVAKIMRLSARPRTFHATLGLHYFTDEGRMPTAEELRSQVYWALAEGAKGINYFSWSFHAGKGLVDYPELFPIVKELNELCSELGDDLNIMHPADTVLEQDDGVQGGVLHHPDGSLLVFIIRDDADTTLEEDSLTILMPEGSEEALTWELIDGEGTLEASLSHGFMLNLRVTAPRASAIIRVSNQSQ